MTADPAGATSLRVHLRRRTAHTVALTCFDERGARIGGVESPTLLPMRASFGAGSGDVGLHRIDLVPADVGESTLVVPPMGGVAIRLPLTLLWQDCVAAASPWDVSRSRGGR